VLCKNCVHVKTCPKRDKPQRELCREFDVYDETLSFKIFERMMISNKAVWLD